MYETAPCVRVVDDDASVLKSLDRLLRAAGFAVRTYPSPQDFLQQQDGDAPGCVVLDLSMPGLDGLQLQQALARSGDPCPVIFISGHGDIPASVQAMKAGAVDFLIKPFDQKQLLAAVRVAIDRDRSARAARAERSLIGVRVAALTPREHQVMAHVVAGHLNKQIAADLGIAEKTVKVHRARVMKKMGVASVADLVWLIGVTKVFSARA
ncbi:MAG TPA: response regulator [Burkholderiales bacterium]|nr:response regulator [Burkholderiales bacterium]